MIIIYIVNYNEMLSYTYVLYNSCFGGFSFNQNFLLELFKRFPPHTPEGQDFFPDTEQTKSGRFEKCKTEPFFGDYHFLIEEDSYVYKYSDNYEPNYIINLKTDKIYFINTHMEKHRANKNLIQFLFERADRLTEDQFNQEYEKLISKTYFEEEKMLIVMPDGVTKKFSIDNWKESKLLVSHMLTRGISGACADLHIAQVKPELTWRIHEYDGSENVIVKFDYYKLIQELVNELQLNNIEPSTSCSPLVARMIRGDMTLDQLKDFERS